MKPEQMTDDQIRAQYVRTRKEMEQWTRIIQGQMAGGVRSANEKHRDKLHALACDLKWEMGNRL